MFLDNTMFSRILGGLHIVLGQTKALKVHLKSSGLGFNGLRFGSEMGGLGLESQGLRTHQLCCFPGSGFKQPLW